MPHLSIEARRIVSLYSCRSSTPSIVQRLEQEKVAVSKRPRHVTNIFVSLWKHTAGYPWPTTISAVKNISCLLALVLNLGSEEFIKVLPYYVRVYVYLTHFVS